MCVSVLGCVCVSVQLTKTLTSLSVLGYVCGCVSVQITKTLTSLSVLGCVCVSV